MPILDLIQTGKIKTLMFQLKFRQELSRTRGGSLRGVDHGVPIWTASFSTAQIVVDDCVEYEARLNQLGGVIDVFLAGDTRRNMPRLYPTGVFSDTATIATLGGDGKSMSLTGLPAGFVLSIGDYFQVTNAGVPLLFSIMTKVTANGSGVSPVFAIAPHYDPSMTTGMAVILKNPGCWMRLEPGSVQFNDADRALGSVSFSGSQA